VYLANGTKNYSICKWS